MTAPALLRGALGPHRRTFLLAVALAAAAALSGAGLIGVAGWLLTGAALSGLGLAFNLFTPSALVRGLSFTRILSRYGEKLVGHDLALRLVAEMRDRIFRRFTRIPPSSGASARLGDLVSRLLPEIDVLDTLFFGLAGPVVALALTGAAIGTAILLGAPAAGLVYLSGLALAGLGLPALLLAANRGTASRLLEARAGLRSLVLDGAAGHADLVAFGQRDRALREAGIAAEAIARLERRRAAASALAGSAIALVAGATGIGVLVMASDAVGGPLLVGMALGALASFETAAVLVRGADRLDLALAAARRVEALIPDHGSAAPERAAAPLPDGAALGIECLWYWRRAGRPLFRCAGLTCEAGSRTAILGDSGAGKSTLFDLVLGLVEPQIGRIRIAGADVVTLDAADLQARVALMAQGTPVFIGTIADNLRLGAPDADDAALWDALRRARLDGVVSEMPGGLETWCGEGGRTLSAGQARRLCLARTLLTGAAILLLDEPTAGLDAEEEGALLADLAAATAGRTVLLATHAAPPPGCVDRVLRIVDGRFVPDRSVSRR